MNQKITNHWIHGPTALGVPPLPLEFRGVSGARLETAVFDSAVGTEAYLAILEDGAYVSELASVSPFQVFCKPLVIPTSFGAVITLIFSIRDDQDENGFYETFLNPHKPDAVDMLEQWSLQTHFKVLLINSDSSEVKNWFELDNVFGIGTVVAALPEVTRNDTPGDFEMAQQELMQNYSSDELRGM